MTLQHSRRPSINSPQVYYSTFSIFYLTIIPRARMGSESIAHEAEGQMGYWLRGYEGERNICFSKIQPVSQKYRDKTTLAG